MTFSIVDATLGLQQQRKMNYVTHTNSSHIFYYLSFDTPQTTFGDKLVTKFMFDVDYTDEPYLPAPEQLKYKIIVKNKKILSDLPIGISSPR